MKAYFQKIKYIVIQMLHFIEKRIYKVKQGQTLRSLSSEISSTPYILIAENDLTEELYEGQLLYLPPPASLYTVQAGDGKRLLCGSEEGYKKKNKTDVFYPGQCVVL